MVETGDVEYNSQRYLALMGLEIKMYFTGNVANCYLPLQFAARYDR